MGRRGAKRQPLGFFGSVGSFTQLYNELKESQAYRVLTPTERLILIDMIRVYGKASAGDYETLSEGIEYTWSVCLEIVAEATFHRARKRICDIGFFESPLDIQSLRPGAPTRFMPSRKWAKCVATQSDANRLAKHNKAKKKRIREKQRRRSRFRSQIGNQENKKSMSKVGRSSLSKVSRDESKEEVSPCRNDADTNPENGKTGMSKLGRSYINHVDSVESSTDARPDSQESVAETDMETLIAEIEAENRRAQKWAPKLGEMHRMEALALLATAK